VQNYSSRRSQLTAFLLESPPPGAVVLKLKNYTLVAVPPRVQLSPTLVRDTASMSLEELLTLFFSGQAMPLLIGGGSVRAPLGNAWVCGGAEDGLRLTIALTLSCEPGQKSADLPR
jgi:hypothetical protein